jgi:hypothetical protein
MEAGGRVEDTLIRVGAISKRLPNESLQPTGELWMLAALAIIVFARS